MSVWGRSAGDVYAVGGDPGHGGGPTAFRLKDRFWQTLPTAGAAGALNWVFGPGDAPEAPVWMVGQNATVLRYDPGAGETVREEVPSPAGTMFWGVWGTAAGDLWAVGGGDGRFQLLHRTGGAWADAGGLLPADLREDAVLYKVWGGQAGDLWVVGSQGTLLRRPAGGEFERVTLPAGVSEGGSLLTVHGDGEGRRLIVGSGAEDGGAILLRWDGAALRLLDLPAGAPPVLNGIRATPSLLGPHVAVGTLGAVVHPAVEGAMELDNPTNLDLHAVWVDERCEVWAAGGDLASENVGGDGILLHYGAVKPAPLFRGL